VWKPAVSIIFALKKLRYAVAERHFFVRPDLCWNETKRSRIETKIRIIARSIELRIARSDVAPTIGERGIKDLRSDPVQVESRTGSSATCEVADCAKPDEISRSPELKFEGEGQNGSAGSDAVVLKNRRECIVG
jgi:hypothetical protein